MKYIQQLDETDCAAACMAMVAGHFGMKKSISLIRDIVGTDTKGTNLAGLVQGAKKLGFAARPLKGNIEALDSNLPVPFIVHLAQPSDGGTLLHFAVLVKIKNGRIFLWDPDISRKKYSLPIDEFCKIWTGYVVFLSPEQNFKPEKGGGNLLFRFLPILRPHIKTLIMAAAASLLLIVFGILSSLYFKYIIDEILFSRANFTLIALSVGMLCIVLFQTLMNAVRSFLLAHFAFKTDLNLVFSYFMHIFYLPLSFFDSRKTGEILSRMEDVAKIRNALSQAVLSVVMDTLMILIIAPVLFASSGKLFAVLLCSVPFSSITIYVFSKLYQKQYRNLMAQAAETQSYLVEAVNGASTVKALNAQEQVFSEYERRQMKMIWTGWDAARLNIFQSGAIGFISQLTNILLFWIGSTLIMKGSFSIGILIGFNALAAYFIGPLERLVNLQSGLQEAFVAADRLGEILELELEQREDKKYIRPERFFGNIECSNLAFRYGTRKPVYDNLNFKIHAGQWVAFVGPSGCGKTSLIKLLLKFYLPEKGTISIDNYDIRDLDAPYLRSKVGYVPQDIFLFSGTIAENIALHKADAALEDIIEAAHTIL